MKVVRVLDAIEVISAATGERQQRRMAVLQRDDRHFSFAEEYYYVSEYDGDIVAQGWARLSPEGVFANADDAEKAARSALRRRHK